MGRVVSILFGAAFTLAACRSAGKPHLLVHGGDLGHADFRGNPGACGLALMGESEGFQLYEVL